MNLAIIVLIFIPICNSQYGEEALAAPPSPEPPIGYFEDRASLLERCPCAEESNKSSTHKNGPEGPPRDYDQKNEAPQSKLTKTELLSLFASKLGEDKMKKGSNKNAISAFESVLQTLSIIFPNASKPSQVHLQPQTQLHISTNASKRGQTTAYPDSKYPSTKNGSNPNITDVPEDISISHGMDNVTTPFDHKTTPSRSRTSLSTSFSTISESAVKSPALKATHTLPEISSTTHEPNNTKINGSLLGTEISSQFSRIEKQKPTESKPTLLIKLNSTLSTKAQYSPSIKPQVVTSVRPEIQSKSSTSTVGSNGTVNFTTQTPNFQKTNTKDAITKAPNTTSSTVKTRALQDINAQSKITSPTTTAIISIIPKTTQTTHTKQTETTKKQQTITVPKSQNYTASSRSTDKSTTMRSQPQAAIHQPLNRTQITETENLHRTLSSQAAITKVNTTTASTTAVASTRTKTTASTMVTASTTTAPSTVVTTERLKFDDCISDTMFVVDSTSSVKRYFEDHRNYVLAAVKELLSKNKDTQIGVIVYSSPLRKKVKLPFASHKNETEAIKIIRELPFFAGITATGSALNLTIEALKNRRTDIPTNVVVITDGFSYDLVDKPSSILHAIPNLRTFVATLSNAWRQYELELIAGDPSRVFKGKDSLQNLVKALSSCNSGQRFSTTIATNKL